ncbi:MAG: CsbD family protein [Desulfobacteraceae bacterium]|nr:CsbD family protein [Desulfobacteraceae bacterium]
MKSSTRENAEGTLHKVKGKIKETVGKLVGNSDLETKGKIEKIQGKIQKKRGRLKDFVGK